MGRSERTGAGTRADPGRELTLVLPPEHVGPRAALEALAVRRGHPGESAAHADSRPEGVLVPGPEGRAHRPPPLSDVVLGAGSPVHRLAGPIGVAAAEQAERLVVEVDRAAELT